MNTRSIIARFMLLLLLALSTLAAATFAQTSRTLIGTLITKDNKAAPNVKIYAGTSETTTDSQGNFSLKIAENITQLRLEGKNVIAKAH